jgi:hypothetical protein
MDECAARTEEAMLDFLRLQSDLLLRIAARDNNVGWFGGWPTFSDFCVDHVQEGAPSLRFLQGWAAMLPVPSDLSCVSPA